MAHSLLEHFKQLRVIREFEDVDDEGLAVNNLAQEFVQVLNQLTISQLLEDLQYFGKLTLKIGTKEPPELAAHLFEVRAQGFALHILLEVVGNETHYELLEVVGVLRL